MAAPPSTSFAGEAAELFSVRQLRHFLIGVIVISLLMSPLLWPLLRFSFKNELYSHLLLIPAVSIYLAWLNRPQKIPTSAPLKAWAVIPAVLGLTAIAIRLTYASSLAVEDVMSLTAAGFVLLVWSASLVFLGRTLLKALIFPLAFLVAFVPFPLGVEHGIETFLQHGSAECAYWMFTAGGVTVLREKLVFILPSITLHIAPECSGIRASLVLLITSIVGGYLFLKSPLRRALLALSIIPLALLRNGFRVFVLGELCEHVGPHMINSAIHHQGGPIFFALSMIPFTGIVWLLMRWESRANRQAVTPAYPPGVANSETSAI